MWLRLAALWGCTVAEAQARCDPREFDEWRAYWRIEPWGSRIEDLRAGIIAAAVANYSGHATEARTPDDMIPWAEPQPEPAQSPRAMQESVREMMAGRRAARKQKGQRHGK